MRVLLIDDFHERLELGLTKHGLEVIDASGCEASQEAVVMLLREHKPEGLMVRSKIFVDDTVITAFEGLRWIGRGGAGMDNIDDRCADDHGVFCFNAGEANSDAVGEQTLAMLLAMFTRLVKSHQEVVDGRWDREGNRGLELKGRTVGILGFGNTGSAVAEKLRGFGVRVIAHDRYLLGFGSDAVEEVSEETLLRESDVLTLHVPLTGETKNWLTLDRLALMKPHFWLMNLSRGAVLDLGLVVKELEAGRILGFAADVLEYEPPLKGDLAFIENFNALRKNNRVVLSPHVGGWTVQSYEKISQVLLDKVLKFYDIELG